MARLAIAKSFLAEYARLDKNVQGAVDAAIAKFAEHPHPRIYLEKPQHSWDDRIRTLEVDTRWRGVVLAPTTGDTYCLVTVLPQDRANAYATSHRFSVNPALGVLEVREEEAIQRKHSGQCPSVMTDCLVTVGGQGYAMSGRGGIQGFPVRASRMAVMTSAPCLRAVSV